MVQESLDSIKLMEELIECPIKGRVQWESESNGPFRAAWVCGVHINGLVHLVMEYGGEINEHVPCKVNT